MALVTGEASHLGCTLANGMAVCCFFLCTCDRCEHMWNSQVVLTVVCHILYRTAAAASALFDFACTLQVKSLLWFQSALGAGLESKVGLAASVELIWYLSRFV